MRPLTDHTNLIARLRDYGQPLGRRTIEESADALEALKAENTILKTQVDVDRIGPKAAAERITSLRAELGQLPEIQVMLMKENKELRAEVERLKESATLWNKRYQEVCQDRTALRQKYGHEIVALEAQLDDAIKLVDIAAGAAPKEQAQPESLTDSYVQTVPDKCDRITWRNRYYHLPIEQAQPERAPSCDHLIILLSEVSANFTRDDDLPDDLLPRIDAAIKQGGQQ